MGLKEELSRELAKNNSIHVVKANLVNRGYLEEDIDKAFKGIVDSKTSDVNKNNRLLGWKEFLDRVGYGFASQQFVNILFMLSGASLFLIGFVNAIKTALIYLLSGFFREYSKVRYFGKSFISSSGIIYGFSFLGMAFSVVFGSPPVFALSLLIGSVGVIAHGDIYMAFHNTVLKAEHRKTFLKFISYFGISITAISLIVAGLLMQVFPISGTPFTINLSGINPINFKMYGYLLAFEITAIMFILSGYLISFIEEKKESMYESTLYVSAFMQQYFKTATENSGIFFKNKKIVLLALAAMLMTVAQIVGNSYYGIFIYTNFNDKFMGGFMNVAVIFVIALIASLSGTVLTKAFAKSLGEAPMLVFGTLLVALLPLTMYFNPNLYAIALSTALSVIGGAVVGVAQGLIGERLMNEKEQSLFFTSLGYFSIIPTLILATIGAIIAQIYGLQSLFLGIGIALGAIVMPVYFILVLIIDKEYRKEHAR